MGVSQKIARTASDTADHHSVAEELLAAADPARARVSRSFFKTGKGEYGAGDIFIGVIVPMQRMIARQHQDLSIPSILILLKSPIHEHRLTALFILISQFERGSVSERAKIFEVYIAHRRCVNNWDLVDASAAKIVGEHLRMRQSHTLLVRLARSSSVWDRRIAIVATYAFIRDNRHDVTLALAEMLLTDPHDLIHKAVGWMLREVGKRDARALKNFLYIHAPAMPRTCLRYAIERFDEAERKKFLVLR